MDINKIQGVLTEEGFRPDIDEDGDLIFKYEGNVFFIELDEDDDSFVKLVLPNFWEIESEAEREAACKAALDATAQIKVAKVFPIENQMFSSAELFLPSEESLVPVLSRLLEVVNGAAGLFAETMRDEYMDDADG